MASTYQQVSYGSRGDAVRQLQTALNSRGYSLDVDGIFGDKTRAAVWDYQKRNNLRLDGIVGSETWGSLLSPIVATPGDPVPGRQAMSGVSDDTARRLSELEKGYTPSQAVTAARAEYDRLYAARPGEYQSSFADQLAELYGQITGRDPFAYDPTRDVTYQRYAADYQRRGKVAMEDTLGRAASLTGGYDSSYAQGAGQQAYARQLEELTGLIPRLEENARRRYDGEGAELLKRYQLLQQQEDAAYGRWNDQVTRWRQTLEIARKAAESAESADRAAYQNALKHYTDKAKAEHQAAAAEAKLAASQSRTASGGSGRSSGSKSGGGSKSSKKSALSSTAAESLERVAGSYLSAGNGAAAGALVAQYFSRMTPAQRRKFETLFGRYGRNMTQ